MEVAMRASAGKVNCGQGRNESEDQQEMYQ